MNGMIVLGLVLLVLVVALSVAIVVSNPAVVELSIFNASVPVTMSGVYFTGAGALLVTLLGLLLIQQGVVRSRKQRRQLQAIDAAPRPIPASPPAPGRPGPSVDPVVPSNPTPPPVASVGPTEVSAPAPGPLEPALLVETERSAADDPPR